MKTTITVLVIAWLTPSTLIADSGSGVTDTPPLATVVRGVYADAHGRQWPVYSGGRRIASTTVNSGEIRSTNERRQASNDFRPKAERSGFSAPVRAAKRISNVIRFANLRSVSSGANLAVAEKRDTASTGVTVHQRPYTLDSRSLSRRVY